MDRLAEGSSMDDGQNVRDMITNPPEPKGDSGKLMKPGTGDNLLDDVNPVDPPDWLVGPGCPGGESGKY